MIFYLANLCPYASGDDRDYCDYDHQISTYLNFREPDHPSVREITVKSISPVKYIRNPGFHLLTLTSPPSTSSTSTPKTFADAPCHLPAHFSNYRSKYFPFTLLTLIILVLSRYRTRRRGRLPTSIRKSSLPTYYQTHHANSTTEEITSESEAWHILEPEDLTEFQDNPYDSYSLALGARISPREPLPTTLRTPSLKPPTGLKTSTSSDGGFYSVGLNSITPTTPTFRASIHSAAPIQSGFMSSPPGERDEYGNEEDDDPMCPSYTQATSSRSHSRRSSYSLGFQPSASSSSRNISGVLSPSASVFFPPATSDSSKNFSTSQAQLSIQQHQQLPQTTLPPPPTQAQRKARNAGWYTFSRSFVFRSRRRRMTILFPVFWSSYFWTSIFSPHHPQRGPSTSNPYSGYPPKLPPTGIVRGSLVDFWRVIWPVVLSWCLLTWWSMS